MDYEIGETLRYWIVASTLLLFFIVLIGAITYHIQNPNLYIVCTDSCTKIDYNSNSISLRADCINKCNEYVGETLDKLITILNSTVEKIDWNK